MQKKIVVTAVTFFLIFLVAAPPLAIFPLFLVLWSVQERIQLDLTHFMRKYLLLGTCSGLLTEVFAVIGNLSTPPEERAQFHPDPGADLLLAAGFYFFVSVVWALLIWKYTFSEKSVFAIGGVWGIVVEQDAAILVSPLTQGIAGVLGYVFVFLVYGSFMAIPLLFFKKGFRELERKERRFVHAILAFGCLFGAYILAGAYMVSLSYGMGLE